MSAPTRLYAEPRQRTVEPPAPIIPPVVIPSGPACGYCGRGLRSVAILYPGVKPCCGRGDCTIRALDEYHHVNDLRTTLVSDEAALD